MTSTVKISRRIHRKKALRAKKRMAAIRSSILILMLTCAVAFGVNALTTALAKENTSAYYDTVIVSYGDTLWDIAQKYNTSNKDLRNMVDKIMIANDMKTTKICVGDKIYIPFN